MLKQPVMREELAGIFEQIAAALRSGTMPVVPAADVQTGAMLATVTQPVSNETDSPAQSQPISASVLRCWKKVGELQGQSYTWPTGPEAYDPFEVWETDDEGDLLQFGLGYVAADPETAFYGRPRGYWLAFEMVNGQKRRAIGVFIEADQASDLVAVIKGKGPRGRSMYMPGDVLPAAYDHLTVDVFRDRVQGPQAYRRLAVVAENADRQAMLNHAAIQSTLRG